MTIVLIRHTQGTFDREDQVSMDAVMEGFSAAWSPQRLEERGRASWSLWKELGPPHLAPEWGADEFLLFKSPSERSLVSAVLGD